jgi:hypothetical protein
MTCKKGNTQACTIYTKQKCDLLLTIYRCGSSYHASTVIQVTRDATSPLNSQAHHVLLLLGPCQNQINSACDACFTDVAMYTVEM